MIGRRLWAGGRLAALVCPAGLLVVVLAVIVLPA